MLTLIIGIIGMSCIVVAFLLDEFTKKYNSETSINNTFNLIGAGLLIYYAVSLAA